MTELEKLIESNAKAISALSQDIAEMRRDRSHIYGLMRDLTEKMSQLVSHQAVNYEVLNNLDQRQQQLTVQQQQLIEIQKSISQTLEKIVGKNYD